ncbi:hypothetical protein [Natronorarus salvus]|uniref:hypothetical protein n=1 Tax=Natronorarus salvus TaxID=3117733 RepID=UPI002F269F98
MAQQSDSGESHQQQPFEQEEDGKLGADTGSDTVISIESSGGTIDFKKLGLYAAIGLIFNIMYGLLMILFIELSFPLFIIALAVTSSIITGFVIHEILSEVGINISL